MAIRFINKEMLSEMWKNIYRENFKEEYDGLYEEFKDEVIIERNNEIVFKGTQNELTEFVIEALHIANNLSLDLDAMNISEEENPSIDEQSYRDFADKYGRETSVTNIDSNIPDGCIRFKEWICEIQFGRYHGNDRIAIELICHNSGEPIAIATVNVPNIPIKENEVIIKDYSENQGMFVALFNAGIVKLNRLIPWHNNIDLYVCELLIEPKFD